MKQLGERVARVEHSQARLEGLLEGLREAVTGRAAARQVHIRDGLSSLKCVRGLSIPESCPTPAPCAESHTLPPSILSIIGIAFSAISVNFSTKYFVISPP